MKRDSLFDDWLRITRGEMILKQPTSLKLPALDAIYINPVATSVCLFKKRPDFTNRVQPESKARLPASRFIDNCS